MDYSLTFSNGEGAAPGILGVFTKLLPSRRHQVLRLIIGMVGQQTNHFTGQIHPFSAASITSFLFVKKISLSCFFRMCFWCWTKSLDFCSWNPPRFLQVNLVPNTRSSHLRPPMGRRTAGRLSRSRGSGSSQCLKGWCSELERCLFEQENDGKEENHGNSVPL